MTMKKTDRIMNKILKLVKDEHKTLVEEKVKKATTDFVNLSEEEQDEWFCDIGTIGYFFDENHLELEDDWSNMLIDSEDEDYFVDLVCEYLDCCLD